MPNQKIILVTENHVILAARSQERGAKAVEDLRARNPAGTVSLLQLDITSDDSIKAAVEKITAEFGVLDALVNNAGIVVTQPKDRRSELLETFNTNVASTIILTEALVPLLQKSKDPRIINVSSGLGSISERTTPESPYYGVPGGAYRVSKAGLNMATANMVFEFKSWNAKVWAYCPGYVVTNLTGENDRQNRIDSGADSSETSAQGILEILQGKRDSEVGKFVARFGKQYNW
ncbi:short-chain dehydrogenase/reductase tropE [Colletotrichum spaethianum]|uniref:Short-chain dehydrogenase/reductase tropE n=1 Tax=Colletotrichum spaethianum TaxID=700344 RepID=A0AA37LCX7_9PEZI|nr:short-chain dehydrogenase/reductase tropE [Colletotrichum spaethianum]GKT41952.1 short-chain dehydrogenase/reductase tropE [Colletotrichum spaethianum]